MSNGNDWADPDELGGLSRAGNVLQSMGYDPDEVRASPALRAEVMGKLGSPYSQGSATPPATNQPSGTPAGVRDQGPVMAALDTANAAPGPRAMTPMPNASMQRPAMALAAQSTASAQPPRPGQTPQPTQAAAAPVAMPKPSQTTGQSSSQVSPTGTASSPAQDVPETLSLGLEGVRGALAAGKQASDVATELQNASAPDTSGIDTKISGESATTPYYDPKTGKIAESAKQAGYEPGVGTRILRGLRGGVVGLLTGGIPGAVVGAIEPQDIAGGTAYGAPDRAYQATEATRQNTLATDQAQRAATLQEFKDQTDRRKGLVGTLKDVSTGYNDAAKTSAELQNAQTNVSKNETQLRKAGYKTDAQGNLLPLDRSEMSPEQQTQMDLHSALQEQAEARAALARAQNDPNSPAFKLASQRASTANSNAAAAIERAQAYALNATGANYGTDTAGNPLQGSTVLGAKPVGSRFQSTVQNQQGRVAQFNDVLGATNNLETTARRLVGARGKNALSSSKVAAALAEPEGTFGKWMQGQVANGNMSGEERDYVTNLRAYRENLQALRKSAGGGVSDSQVDRLMEMAPGAATPDLDYLLRQTGQIRATANRLSKGIPNVTGGIQVEGQGGTAAPAAGGDEWFNQYPKAQ
jgi:hypothetical protein